MNQEKIGKLIAKLRRSKGLTQSELGELVGVGFRAVSKWENGQTLPDISIINELSRVLEVSVDELLCGELKSSEISIPVKEEHKSINKKLLLIPILLLVVLLIIFIFINSKTNKEYEYEIYSADKQYTVEGKLIIKDSEINILINKLVFNDNNFSKTIVKNYEYSVISGDILLFGQGYIDGFELLEHSINIQEIAQNFKVDYFHGIDDDSVIDIISNPLIIKIVFLDRNSNAIEIKIKLSLRPIK